MTCNTFVAYKLELKQEINTPISDFIYKEMNKETYKCAREIYVLGSDCAIETSFVMIKNRIYCEFSRHMSS